MGFFDFAKPVPLKEALELHVTLWPAFPHFNKFASDSRIQGIRLNSAMMAASEIDVQFERNIKLATVPLWFDIKGMQMRIKEVVCGTDCDHLEFKLNRPVQVDTPCPVWFKGGEDCALLVEIRDGNHFIFEGGPRYEVRAGESIHIREKSLHVGGPPLLDYELEKLDKIKSLGFTNYYLSYVYDTKHINALREIIGKDANLILKIENKAGLRWIRDHYKRMHNTQLAAARGDLFVEVNYPHHIMQACQMIIEKDRRAMVGSRMLLSVIHSDTPSCADLTEMAWLYDNGYNNFLLCDELCLKDELLSKAVNVFDAFRRDYCEM